MSPEQHRYNPPSLIMAKALRRIEQALMQGYTTVRDAGGADYGLREAVSSGLFPGPRMLVSGRVLSQTGGHGDKRRRAEWIEPIGCCVGMIGVIADGPDEVRKAAREQIRHDVDQIKIMASGGAMSPGDELDTTQYTVEEMRAAVEEARAVGKYVLAHAYSPAAVRNAVQAGVRSIEHGNLIDGTVAREIKKAAASPSRRWSPTRRSGARARPTASPSTSSRRSTWPASGASRGSPTPTGPGARSRRARICWATCNPSATVEFELKGQVMKPMEVLLSATRVNAELFRMEHEIGTVEPGKYADLIALKGNPLKDLRVFQNLDNLHLIMKGGVIYKRTL